jgi:hypothetical protein
VIKWYSKSFINKKRKPRIKRIDVPYDKMEEISLSVKDVQLFSIYPV